MLKLTHKDPFIDPKKMDDLAMRTKYMATTYANFDGVTRLPFDRSTDQSPTLRKNLNTTNKHKLLREQVRGFKKYESDMYAIGRGSLDRVSQKHSNHLTNAPTSSKFDRSISSDIKTSACRTTTNFGNMREKN